MSRRAARPVPDPVGPGQESVWAYPRPPVLRPDARLAEVLYAGQVIARSRRTLRHLETASPPTVYFPPEDVDLSLLAPAAGTSFCEWKGRAGYWDIVIGEQRADRAAWSYADPEPSYVQLRHWLAFYPARVDECRLDGERVEPQPGPFYGGWITDDVRGPFKGAPGTEWW